MGRLKTVFDSLREADEQQAAALAAAQKRFQAISSGMFSGDDGEDATLAQQLMSESRRRAAVERARVIRGDRQSVAAWSTCRTNHE